MLAPLLTGSTDSPLNKVASEMETTSLIFGGFSMAEAFDVRSTLPRSTLRMAQDPVPRSPVSMETLWTNKRNF